MSRLNTRATAFCASEAINPLTARRPAPTLRGSFMGSGVGGSPGSGLRDGPTRRWEASARPDPWSLPVIDSAKTQPSPPITSHRPRSSADLVHPRCDATVMRYLRLNPRVPQTGLNNRHARVSDGASPVNAGPHVVRLAGPSPPTGKRTTRSTERISCRNNVDGRLPKLNLLETEHLFRFKAPSQNVGDAEDVTLQPSYPVLSILQDEGLYGIREDVFADMTGRRRERHIALSMEVRADSRLESSPA